MRKLALFAGLAGLACATVLRGDPALAPVDQQVAQLVEQLSAGKAAVVKPVEGHAGLRAYLMENTERGHRFVVYATEDGTHLITGRVFDAQGSDLTGELLDAYAEPLEDDIVLRDVEKTYYVEEGAGGRVLYVVADPNCGHCKKLHAELEPHVDAGEVTVRWVMVDILRDDGTAAGVLAADRRGQGSQALEIALAGDTSTLSDLAGGEHANDEVYDNERFMKKHNIGGTPYLVWASTSGSVQTMSGKPRDLSVVLETLKGNGNDA